MFIKHMELENFLFAFFIIIIFLTIISLIPSKSQAGQFLFKPNTDLESTFILFIISISVIIFIKAPKKYYRPIPLAL